jgi:HNH endonuclease
MAPSATATAATAAAATATAARAARAAEPRFRTRPLSRDRGGDARSAALAESMVAHQQAISVHHHAMLADIAEFSRSGAFRGDGALSMAAWLTEHCRVGAAQARTLVTAAEKMEELPRLSDALSAGRLTLDVLAPIAAVATAETDGELAEASLHWTVRQAKEFAQAVRGATDAQAARAFIGRSVRFDDARCSLWVQLTKDAYAVVKSTLVARATRHDHPSTSDADYEPFERRLADALVEVCTERGRSEGKSSGPSGGNSGGPLFGGAPATVIVHADVSLFADCGSFDQDANEGSASIESLGPISEEIVRRLSCDAKHTISLEAPDGTILDQFPMRRSPTTAQRIEIARRDNGCRFSGCGYNLITNVHHLRHWIDGGPTVLSNLITLCAAHHSRMHELGWKMSGDANELVTFTSPHGRQSTSSPSPVWRRSLPARK